MCQDGWHEDFEDEQNDQLEQDWLNQDWQDDEEISDVINRHKFEAMLDDIGITEDSTEFAEENELEEWLEQFNHCK